MMKIKNVFDGLFASTLSDDEFAELSGMTKRELATLYVDAQVAAGVIGEPADRAATEEYVARQFRKIELIDGIVMLRGEADIDDEDIDESDCDMDVTRDIADVSLWPASAAPVTMTVDESDDIRMREDDERPRSFMEEWGLPRRVAEDLKQYADEYDDLASESGEAFTPDEVAEMLYDEIEKATSQWTDEDEAALTEMGALWAYEMDDDDDGDDIVDEWTEWLVLAGELERIDTSDDAAMAIWAWCPDHRAELPGADDPMDSLDEARRVFDAYDPLGLWFARRHAEAAEGQDPQIWRRYEVDLVCQTCTRSSDGLIAVRDDAVRLSKSFDIDGDVAAQSLIKAILSHI